MSLLKRYKMTKEILKTSSVYNINKGADMKTLIVLFIFFCAVTTFAAEKEIEDAFLKLSSFNKMREGLAATLDGRTEKITQETFSEVCLPVGKALKEWGLKKNYQVRQIAEKYRNPNNAPTPEEKAVIKLFTADPSLVRHEAPATVNGFNGTKIYVRIPVVSSCLHCHGDSKSRPEFIKSKYKNDKAFGFKAGDLRGLYSAFIPTSSK